MASIVTMQITHIVISQGSYYKRAQDKHTVRNSSSSARLLYIVELRGVMELMVCLSFWLGDSPSLGARLLRVLFTPPFPAPPPRAESPGASMCTDGISRAVRAVGRWRTTHGRIRYAAARTKPNVEGEGVGGGE